MGPCIKVSERHNAIYGKKDFARVMLHAAITNGQAAGCAESSRNLAKMLNLPDRPTEEWIRATGQKSEEGEIMDAFSKTVSSQAETLRLQGLLGRDQSLDDATDMHLIPRHDKNHDKEIIKGKHKNGTNKFERYITIQYVTAGFRFTLALLHMPALSNTADFVRKLIETTRNSGANLDMVELDREFFSAEVMHTLNSVGVRHIIPCKNTDVTIPAIAEFVAGRRDKVSKMTISRGGGSTDYWMYIVKRKKIRRKKKDGEDEPLLPHEEYIGFATNDPTIDVEKYEDQWGIETGYSMVEGARAKTHSKSLTVRLLYFVFSVTVFNAWVMMNALMAWENGLSLEKPLIRQRMFNELLLLYYVYDIKLLPIPPPAESK